MKQLFIALVVLGLCNLMQAQSVADRKLCADSARQYVAGLKGATLLDIQLTAAQECLVRFYTAKKDQTGRSTHAVMDVFTNNTAATCTIYDLPMKIDKKYACFAPNSSRTNVEDYRDKSFEDWQAAAIQLMRP